MCTFDWENFLRQWSREILESRENFLGELPIEVIDSGWLGYPGATEEQLSHAEVRLEVTLPPSYRAFLKVTNGWRQTTPFIHRLWSTEEIGWFSRRHQDWINAFIDRYLKQQYPDNSINGWDTPIPPTTDAEYFVYSDTQDCRKLRVDYLQTALEISDKGDSAIYLLNPQVITEDGEWEAWFFGDWLPGADRYRSFCEMMQAEYENFLDLKEI
ncbi:MAG: SMI1/KNR4 family protein [Mastigocoleus sp. MO_167.B18]|uniref:SMI1/KNR4 family protein n=1 Tax=Mastigocoleus sp. MO_188.B34 TaxID=3036635 RepID=UPI0026122C09|nr:SMI1/KNR4 family protein [Mastigocoleus sp. MO_188.B34]MDJ0693014.1 SMI1/KNR4 family protein [Mastigocoleus sp. MO_188.B34]MDJ0772447.1 SMI1/KNR4 family protein [Mastigocoleus sp. MO_167.B18]